MAKIPAWVDGVWQCGLGLAYYDWNDGVWYCQEVIPENGTPPAGGNIDLPHISKPVWLVNFLADCNWTILTWYVNPGEWIESAIDWVLDQINNFLEVIEGAINAAAGLGDDLGDLWDNVSRVFDRIWDQLQDFWGDIPGLINSWWEVTKSTVRGWIEASEDWLLDRLEDARDFAEMVLNEWDDFMRFTLPNYLPSWDIDALIKSAFSDFSDLWDLWGSNAKAIIDFFTDPVEWADKRKDWLLDKFCNILARFI